MSLRPRSGAWRRAARRLVFGAGLALLAPACGGEEGEGLELAVTRAGLSADITRARLDLHPSDRACGDIRGSGPAVLGTYVLDLDLTRDPQPSGVHQADLSRLRVATYTLAIWGFGASGDPQAFGCVEGVAVAKGERTRASVTLEPYTP